MIRNTSTRAAKTFADAATFSGGHRDFDIRAEIRATTKFERLRFSTAVGEFKLSNKQDAGAYMMAFGTSADAIHKRIESIRSSTLSPDWDADGAEPLSHDVIAHAEHLANYVLANAPLAPDPVISPAGDGTVHIRWLSGSTKVVVEVGAAQSEYFVKTASGVTEGVCQLDDEVVDLVKTHIRQRQ